jgi:hypothetical protein
MAASISWTDDANATGGGGGGGAVMGGAVEGGGGSALVAVVAAVVGARVVVVTRDGAARGVASTIAWDVVERSVPSGGLATAVVPSSSPAEHAVTSSTADTTSPTQRRPTQRCTRAAYEVLRTAAGTGPSDTSAERALRSYPHGVVQVRVDPSSDLYATLGVDAEAPRDEIAQAFRRLAKDLHPDRDGGDAERFKRLAAAWTVLGDPVRRDEYDTARESLRAVAERAPAGVAPPRPPSRRVALLMVWGGAVLTLLGVAVAVATSMLVLDTARFRDRSEPATATIVEAANGTDPEIRFTTADGQVVQVAEPERTNPGARGDTLDIRYDPDDATHVRVDESTAARDITIGIVAVKLLVGGPVLVVFGARRLRRSRRTR